MLPRSVRTDAGGNELLGGAISSSLDHCAEHGESPLPDREPRRELAAALDCSRLNRDDGEQIWT